MKYFTNIFLRIEDRARHAFEHTPFIHALFAGFGVVLFWRGTWELADHYDIAPWISILLGILILGGIGLFLQTFVGNTLIIKNIEKDKALTKKATAEVQEIKAEVREEEVTMAHLARKLEVIEARLTDIANRS